MKVEGQIDPPPLPSPPEKTTLKKPSPVRVNVATFLNCHNLSNIARYKTSFKNLSNPSCIDFIITNKPFQRTISTSIGLSDFYNFVTTTLKVSFKEALPKEVFCRNY